MTIFRKIVIEFLIQGIEKIQLTSESYDQGRVNLINQLTFWARDRELSGQKRKHLDLLKNNINELSEATDSVTTATLCDLLTKCKHDLSDFSTKKAATTGTTEVGIDCLNNFVKFAAEKICCDLSLTDAIVDDDIINKFEYYCAKAYGRSAYDEHFVKVFNLRLSISEIKVEPIILSSEKEEIILFSLNLARALDQTRKAAQESEGEASMTDVQYRHFMFERADYIQKEVAKIDTLASNVYVNEYMNEAIKFIKPPVLTITSAEENNSEQGAHAEGSQNGVVTSAIGDRVLTPPLLHSLVGMIPG